MLIVLSVILLIYSLYAGGVNDGVSIQNQYNGIPIDGSVFSVTVDDAGIPFSSGKWVRVQPTDISVRDEKKPI
jgi:hypothetical protein